ncbi:MAG: restriction endonuclease subunit S [Sulfuricurvum sp.]|nr:restriction endonuclease subunit S [Sulfuricurvum sp.]MDD5385577.1 restriction endonuclease subunit S [Sulfuricurvum sp.]
MSEWKECTLGELGLLQRGRSRHRPRYAFHLYGGAYPFIQTGEIREAKKYIDKYEHTYSEAGLAQSKLWQKGTLCITIAANIAELAILKFDACFPDSVLGFISDEEKVDGDFIYYTLTHFQKELKHIGEGSVQDNINLGTFENITFPIPSLKEQKAIAEILSSLDDKIDLLHRQNKTLEELAQTFFRQWFIEEANDEWKTCKLEDIAVMQNGFSFSSGDYVPYEKEHLEVLKMGHIKKGGGLKLNPKKDFVPREEKLEKWILDKDDIVMAMTDMKDNVVILGVPAIIDESNKYVLNQRVARIYLKSNERLLNNYLLYIQLKDPDFIALLQSKANSGVQVNLSTQSIKDSEIIIPPMRIQETVGKYITDLFLKKENNDLQIRTLESMRDTLLPKFMSGEVKINFGDVNYYEYKRV